MRVGLRWFSASSAIVGKSEKRVTATMDELFALHMYYALSRPF